ELSAMVLKGMGYKQSELSGSWPLNYRNKALELGLYDGIYENMTKTQVAQMDYDAAATRGDAVLMITAGLAKLQERGKEDLPAPDSHSYDDGTYDWIDGLPTALSIEQAVDIMQHQGYLAEMAELNRKADEATAKGYADNVKTLKDGLALLDVVDIETAMAMNQQGITKGNYEIAKIQKKFANDNIENNYQAELNSIEYQTVSLYYGVLQAQENLRVAEDNLAVQEEMLKVVRSKNKVGMAPAIEVTSQQNQVTGAQKSVKEAKAALENAKMNFNLLLGYSVTDNVALTDGLTALPFPEMTLEEAISSAVANRLDNAQIQYGYELASVAMKYLKAGKNSTAYLTQENQLKQMELQLNNMPKTLEIEIRNDYIDLTSKYQAIQDAQEKLTLVKESFRVAKVMYDVGMNTLADVQSAQLTVYQTNQLLMKSIADYDIAVYEYKYATGLGKNRISF
ncbi:MAG: TolC family protein, partial [Firmicutes bacterium]|nr:TolC family protein [Bacillota bacterium]